MFCDRSTGSIRSCERKSFFLKVTLFVDPENRIEEKPVFGNTKQRNAVIMVVVTLANFFVNESWMWKAKGSKLIIESCFEYVWS